MTKFMDFATCHFFLPLSCTWSCPFLCPPTPRATVVMPFVCQCMLSTVLEFPSIYAKSCKSLLYLLYLLIFIIWSNIYWLLPLFFYCYPLTTLGSFRETDSLFTHIRRGGKPKYPTPLDKREQTKKLLKLLCNSIKCPWWRGWGQNIRDPRGICPE